MKVRGSLIIEAVVGLSITVIGILALTFNMSQAQEIVTSKNQEIDYQLAQKILHENKMKQIKIHDKIYQIKK